MSQVCRCMAARTSAFALANRIIVLDVLTTPDTLGNGAFLVSTTLSICSTVLCSSARVDFSYGIRNLAERVVILHLEASTFPNQVGTDQKRPITSLTADELMYSGPAAMSGVQVHQVWKRAE
jgi:hypothetical protein